MEEAIVLYPSPVIGHLVSMVELGKLILTHNPSLSLHVIIAPAPYRTESTASYISSVSMAVPSIIFHHLPAIPPYSATPTTRNHHESLTLEILCFSNPHVHRTLYSISTKYNIRAMVIDFFCTAALEVSAEFEILTFYFFTSGAACLTCFLYLPVLHESTTKSLKDIDTFLDIPGAPPVRGSDMAKPLLERNDEVYECLIAFSKHFPNSAGIIVNTFEMLEPRAIKAISDGLCVPDRPTPPIYPIGPIIAAGDRRVGSASNVGGVHFCLTWLDSQPQESVVFLCFGSLGLFSKEQLHEIAVGLERSGQRFLWVVRSPPISEDQAVAMVEGSDPDLNSLLPNGFLERTRNRGLVVKSWAPQTAVLSHHSVGGFVTHCGWNSVLEAVSAGVPMVAWPLYAEQRFNRVLMVEEIKIALPITESENGFASSIEVEKRVKELMEAPEGESVRKRTKAMKNAAKAALRDGGSSHAALTALLNSWKQ